MDINLISLKKGYFFERGNMFKEYISDYMLYEIKQSYKSTYTMYLISKLLMNYLYALYEILDLE